MTKTLQTPAIGLPIGTIVAGKYRIIEELGRGGMGVVYKAEDTKLKRAVALKFLPEELAHDHQAVERFQREARAASALNHPHICIIYDIDEHEGKHFIALEFLEGKTLREYLLGKRLAVDQIVDLAIQVAGGLEAAHTKGIMHRDIKPGNIFVTDSGQVKILDFGLAKLLPEWRPKAEEKVAPAMPTMTAEEFLTSPGTAVGTVAYMSPEQARGEDLDARTDLFSFGVVLYEMATGQQAFRGSTSAVIFDAILHKAPTSPVRLNPDLPPELEWVINKALEKDRRLRYQSAADMRVDLERLRRDSTGARTAVIEERVSSAPQRPSPTSAKARWGWKPAAVIGVIGVAAIGTVLLTDRKRPSEPPVPRIANAVKVTTAMGEMNYPSWSPDGRALAYQSDQAGNWDIWVTQLGNAQAVNRTADSPVYDAHPSWSPDGQWIAFFSTREGGGYFIMPGVGGPARKIYSWPTGDRYPVAPQWSLDSTQLAFAVGQVADPWIEILTLATGASRKLVLPVRPRSKVIIDIGWSPDGRWLAYGRALSPISATAELWLIGVSDGASVQLTDGSKQEWAPVWAPDSRVLFFISNRGGTPDLWEFSIGADGRARGAPRQVTAGIEMSHAAMGPKGQKLAYAKKRDVCNAFRAPLPSGRPVTWADATQLTFDEASVESIDVSRNGRILVSSNRSGNWDVYLLSPGGGDLQQLTTDPAIDSGPRWSPGGNELAFYSSRTGHRQVWVMPMGGGPARQLTHRESDAMSPAWSPDGQRIASEGEEGISVVPAQGGPLQRLTDGSTDSHPDWSPDGRWIVFDSRRSGSSRLWLIPASGGQPEPLTKGPAWFPRWSLDGKQVYFVGTGNRVNNVWVVDVGTRVERPVTALTGRRGRLGELGLATDGKSLYFTWEESRGDIWVADFVPSAIK